MNAFLGELGKRLAERWLTLLVLPGGLFLAAAAGAHALGQAHPAAVGRINTQITTWSRTQAATTTAGQVLLLAAILAAAAAAGLAAQAFGATVERVVLAANWHRWPSPLRWSASRRTAGRQRRWDTHHEEYSRLYRAAAPAGAIVNAEDRERRAKARDARTRIALERPQRPTWSGDRINAAAARVKRDRQLDLATLWPHLWLTMPETTRTEITEARLALTRATTLAGWAVLYAALTWWWWPAAILAAVLAAIARRRIRAAADAYATLLEAAARIHTGDLARVLGVPDADTAPTETGESLMSLLRSTLPLSGGTPPSEP